MLVLVLVLVLVVLVPVLVLVVLVVLVLVVFVVVVVVLNAEGSEAEKGQGERLEEELLNGRRKDKQRRVLRRSVKRLDNRCNHLKDVLEGSGDSANPRDQGAVDGGRCRYRGWGEWVASPGKRRERGAMSDSRGNNPELNDRLDFRGPRSARNAHLMPLH